MLKLPSAMANRTCGRIYYAHQLEGATPSEDSEVIEHTEVILVREEEGPDPGYIAAIPTTAERGMTSLQWINDKKAVETAAVRYVRTPKAGLRLKEELPTNWKPGEYRAFSVRNIPYSILVSQDPTLRLPFKPPSIADLIRPQDKTTPEEPGPELTRQLVETVSGLAEKVEALMQERTTETRKSGERPPAEKLALAEQKLALEGKLESKKLAFAEQPGGGSTEEQLRLADLIAAQGAAGKGRVLGAAEANRGAEHSSDSRDSDEKSEQEKVKKDRKKKDKKVQKKPKKENKPEKKKKKKSRSPSVTSSSSGGESSDGSSSSASRGRRGIRRGGASKLRAYERKKRAARKKPIARWRHLEKLAAKSGYVGEAAVERYIGDTSKLGKAKSTLYLASLLARCGERAAAGDAQGAAGTAAGALMYLDMLHVYGDIEIAWLVALENDPQAALKAQNLEKTLSIPEPGQKQNGKKGTSVRLNFSQLAEAETLEAALEVCKSWAGYDTLARGLQTN